MAERDIYGELKKASDILAMPQKQLDEFLVRTVLRHGSQFDSEVRARDALRQEFRSAAALVAQASEKVRGQDESTLASLELRLTTKLDDEIATRKDLCKTVLRLRLTLAYILGGLAVVKLWIEYMSK